MHRCGVEDPSLIWEEVMQLGIKNWGNMALKGLVCRLVFGSVVNNLWRTINEFKHSGQQNIEEQIIKKILWEVRARIVGKGNFPKTRENLSLVSLWNLLVCMLK